MDNEFPENIPQASQGDAAEAEEISSPEHGPNIIARWMETLLQMGLGESILRVGTNALSLIVVFMVIALMQRFYREAPTPVAVQGALAAAPTPTPSMDVEVVPPPVNTLFTGIPRMALLHTTIPSRPRLEITKYTVQQGDTVFGIAEKYGLDPQTILWGNYFILLDDPHNLVAGQELTILPTNGTYYEWQEGDGLNGVAKFFGVKPEDIVNYPGNHLDPDKVGDFAHPNIEPGAWLIIPGGRREFVSWSAPLGVTRDNPAIAAVLGPGACDAVSGGAVGYGTFVWPANQHYLSGFDYSPETNHRGIDIAGHLGAGVFATDAGVVVYAGWNNYGYGNMIMIDHGTGFQSLYAHLNEIYVGCGQSVGQGDPIGAIGSTGRSSGAHLHFELMTSRYGKVNPWDFLPPP
ncbi:MAG: M23 family metallopeptidase [Chloroflexi bacterium]|nr:M23 family metallopeptidase [Chloroflexota bacterium]